MRSRGFGGGGGGGRRRRAAGGGGGVLRCAEVVVVCVCVYARALARSHVKRMSFLSMLAGWGLWGGGGGLWGAGGGAQAAALRTCEALIRKVRGPARSRALSRPCRGRGQRAWAE